MKNFDENILKAYFVCGTQDLTPKQDLPTLVEQALKAGVTAYQYRDKGQSKLTASERLKLGIQLHTLCQQYHVPLIVDDDVDLAEKIGAEGIHVGQSDEKIDAVLNQVGDHMIVGLSCSNLKEVQEANQRAAINYLGCGPVFPTTSKADASPVIYPEGLSKLNKAANFPIVGIGGIDSHNIEQVAATGVAGAAVISMITRSQNIPATVSQMLKAF